MSETMIFPPVVSSEYETRPVIWINIEGSKFRQTEQYLPFLLKAIHTGRDAIAHTGFMMNGGRVYEDGRGPEYCMPECNDPFELVHHSIAMDKAYVETLADYANVLAGNWGTVGAMVRLNRRVVDSELNSWSCHDNISIPNWFARVLSADAKDRETPISLTVQVLLKHLMWRSFISGAGLVTPQGIRFAQKIDTVRHFSKYGFVSSFFRVDSDFGSRLEARSSDRNLNNAAAVMRVGGMALVAAILQTPLVASINTGRLIRIPEQGRDFNGLDLMPDGTIKPSSTLIEAVDGEQRIAEVALSQLTNFVDVPESYLSIAEMIYQYCEDFRRVMSGDAAIDLIEDRSDWARKMGMILKAINENPRYGALTDIKSRSIDLSYDLTTILARGGIVGIRHGQGVKDQSDEALPCTPVAKVVTAARTTPPNTRAADRVDKLLTYKYISYADWKHLIIGDARVITFQPEYKY